MIVSQFSILEIDDSGGELSMGPHQVRQEISFLMGIFANVKSGLVALCMKRSSKLICAVAALLEKRVPFMIVQSKNQAISFGARWLFNGKQLIELSYNDLSGEYATSELCYVIRTSGSTGVPKLVGVPYSCIEPNIEDFREKFDISHEDTVLCSTSFLFDPSIVEIFLSFVSGARLLLVSDNARSQPHLLSNILRTYVPSFVQIKMVPGGENFPLGPVNRFRTASNGTKIFNVYGVTEVSCWATASEVKYRSGQVGIGVPLKCTTLTSNANDELLIGGSRKCFIDGVLSGEYTSTGDIVERRGDEFFIVGRVDDQVKVNGIRCNLAFLSEQAASLDGVTFAQFLLYKEKFLILFVVSVLPLESCLGEVIPSAHYPSKVVYLDNVPVNSNGKTDRSQLIEILEHECHTQMKSFSSVIDFLKKFRIASATDFSFHTFLDYAAEIALYLGKVEALHDILSPQNTIAEVLEKYLTGSCRASEQDGVIPWNVAKDLLVIVDPQPITNWAFYTGKCIDSTPLLVKILEEDHVVAASHSGLVVCIRVRDGICRWQKRLQCRFEASAARCDNYIVLGGFDGCIYFLSIFTGSSEWKFSTGDIVKAPCATADGFVYVPSYDKNLHKLNSKLKNCCWSSKIQSGSPASVVLWNESVFVTTIRGSVEAVDSNSGEHRWVCQSNSPIFSSVTLLNNIGYVSSVDGTITKIRLDSGLKEGTVTVKEPIFASVAIFDDHVYAVTERGCLFTMTKDLSIIRCLRFTGCSFVVPPHRITPSVFVLVSSPGMLVVYSESEDEVHGFRLGNGSVFSRVVFSDQLRKKPYNGTINENRYILAGSRDDWLRCFKIPANILKFLN